jgi:tetratricopeptide (TPR) repeat protein
MTVSQFKLPTAFRHAISIAALILFLAGCFVVGLWGFANAIVRNSDGKETSEFAARLIPNDPEARYRYAVALERTFDFADIARSLREYEEAVALSPHNLGYWLALGRARERDGDRPGAEIAYRHALGLAPNYARAKWALGNNLLRQGKTDEGIELIRGAVDQESTFAAPAVTAAMQVFDGDVPHVIDALGSSSASTSELAKFLASEGRFDEARAAWQRIDANIKRTTLRDAGLALHGKFVEAKRFRDAAMVTSSITENGPASVETGVIYNGGFESGVALQSKDMFDWQIGKSYPLFGLSDSQPKEGKYSLLVRFNASSKLDFESVSRTVVVDPGETYVLSLSYRSEITTRAQFAWEVISGSDQKRLALSAPLSNASGWTELSIPFAVPTDTDGVTFRLVRDNCNSAACTVSGNLWFDDFKLSRK